ncbi:hypothetical protein [Streptomyces malaysiensis]|nr:hypothetical protein R8789_01085 [Streptomyces malaysiensis]
MSNTSPGWSGDAAFANGSSGCGHLVGTLLHSTNGAEKRTGCNVGTA